MIQTRYRDVEGVPERFARARFARREFRNLDPHRDNLFSPSSGATTSNSCWTSAFFHAVEDEEVYVRRPDEWSQMEGHAGKVWRMVRVLFWRRKRPKSWLLFAPRVLRNPGSEQTEVQPCFLREVSRGLLVEVHMDDFHGCGPDASIEWALAELRKNMLLKHCGLLGLRAAYAHLKRNRHRSPQGVLISVGAGHAKNIVGDS